jgi:hypothetical protein
MSNRKRLHRAAPARTAPLRNFSKLYSLSDSPNSTNSAKPAHSDTPRKVRSAGPLAEGVELAYSVIDKYIAEGRRTAEGISNQAYPTRAANDNLQDILERTLRFQSEMLPLWVETLATLVKVAPLQNGAATAPEAWPRPSGAPKSETMAVSIEVVSLRPVQVSVELRPSSESQPLVALGLNAVDPKKPVLTDISLVPDEVPGRVKLRLRIPENQPPGTYSGVIVNRDNGETQGTLSIRIAD